MTRAAIFIDGGYLTSVCRDHFQGARPDFQRFTAELLQSTQLLRTYYYDCPPYQGNPPTPEESDRVASKQRFFSALSRLPRFEVRLGKLAKRGVDQTGQPIFTQKRVDILLGVDMVQLAATRQIDTAILVAGDSDFVPAIEAIKPHGVLTTLWHGPKSRGTENTVHQELWDACDERHELTRAMVDSMPKLR